MSTTMTVYAVEYGNSPTNRTYAMTGFSLKSGFAYDGIQLFSTKEGAEAAMAEEVAEGEDPEELGVSLLKINRNGDLYDEYGTNLHDSISAQNNQSKRDVRQHLQQLFSYELTQRRHRVSQDQDQAIGM